MRECLKKSSICVVLCMLLVIAMVQRGLVFMDISERIPTHVRTSESVNRTHGNINEGCVDKKCNKASDSCLCGAKQSKQNSFNKKATKLKSLNNFIIKNLTGNIHLRVKNCSSTHVTNFGFRCTVPCPEMPKFRAGQDRPQLMISCNTQPTARVVSVRSVGTVQTIDEKSRCLDDYIPQHCNDNHPVPNVVHYMWFSKHEMNFYHFLSVISASRYLRPCLILFHGDHRPYGFYWDYLLHAVPNIIHVHRQPPRAVFGKKLANLEHKADVGRIETLQRYGGIYLDTDEIILKSLTPLRKYPFTLSHALDDNLSNGLILSEPKAAFLNLWFDQYKTYTSDQWAFHSTIMPYKLSKKYPHLIHIENKTFVRPNYTQLPLLFKMNFDWSKNYAIHLYIRFYKYQHDFNDVKYLNTTIGSVARFVLYGNKELCSL